ncbi:MAG: formate-dependent phosphoribosylglycinamide formyltransferase [Myxococcota bacterium]
MNLGTALCEGSTKVLMLGSGELGREVVLELMRLGVEVIACDSYANAPGMQFAHRARVFDMQDGAAVRAAVEAERPDLIVPEIEAIATQTLVELEAEGWNVIPTARAAQLTMDREGIRKVAAEELGLPTSAYRFASTLSELQAAVADLGLPLVVKPVMSSSGKGQSVIREAADVEKSWNYAMEGKRGRSVRVIAEAFVDFDTEITLLTVRTRGEGTLFCPPIGHRQERGDYMESWQPELLSPAAVKSAEDQARKVTDYLGGTGVFGVEFFIKGETVIFSELSPRPHDTGMVTMATQDMSEFELHARAILGLPIGEIRQRSPGASAVILAEAPGANPRFEGVEKALADPRAKLRLFGKPVTRKHRRMGVVVAYADTTDEARAIATRAAQSVRVSQDEPVA